MLELNHLRIQRGDFTLEADLQLDAPVTAIFGPSGAGKSTLLAAVAGLIRPNAGRIGLDDIVLHDGATGASLPASRRRIGMVFQDGRLFPHYTVRGNLRYGERLLAAVQRRIVFDDVVNLLELNSLLDRRVDRLSGGERQRVALGRALLCSPRLLLLDEPLASLDAGLKRQIVPFLRRVIETSGIPMLYVSHDIGEILQLTEDLVVLDKGRVVGAGKFRDVITDRAVFRLARNLSLENVLTVRVVSNLVEDGLTELEIVGAAQDASRTVLMAPLQERAPGALQHVSVRPEDIALSTQQVTGISIRNQIAGRVAGVTEQDGTMLVEVDVGAPLFAEVSPKAVRALALRPDMTIYCLFKAHAVRYLDA